MCAIHKTSLEILSLVSGVYNVSYCAANGNRHYGGSTVSRLQHSQISSGQANHLCEIVSMLAPPLWKKLILEHWMFILAKITDNENPFVAINILMPLDWTHQEISCLVHRDSARIVEFNDEFNVYHSCLGSTQPALERLTGNYILIFQYYIKDEQLQEQRWATSLWIRSTITTMIPQRHVPSCG